MPELAEVEYFRKRWDAGLAQKVTRVLLHERARIFRGVETQALAAALTGAKFTASEARGKQMLFRFSGGAWLGLHLGMSGKLSAEPADFAPSRHDHLVLCQKQRALVFHDPRMFGRVQFVQGRQPPPWWSALPPAIDSAGFTRAYVAGFLARHAKLAVKAALLLQSGFAGIGNWMADEILWQARVHPRTPAGQLTPVQVTALHRLTRKVCTVAMQTIGLDWSDPPKTWLIHARWKKTGRCPRDQTALSTGTIGGRTTRWCPHCQGS